MKSTPAIFSSLGTSRKASVELCTGCLLFSPLKGFQRFSSVVEIRISENRKYLLTCYPELSIKLLFTTKLYPFAYSRSQQSPVSPLHCCVGVNDPHILWISLIRSLVSRNYSAVANFPAVKGEAEADGIGSRAVLPT